MATPTSDTDTTIEALLQQRAQYEQWLARLDSAADKAPPAVRQRVRADYEGRLKGVIEELRGHSATIGEELERHRATQSQLDRERRQAEEELAEAEVRHTVGEFAEDEWRRINEESQSNLNRLRQELSTVGGEISRLSEVQALITAAPRRQEPAAAATHAAPKPEPAPTEEPELEIDHRTPPPTPAPPPTAARPTPTSKREPAPVAPPGDELAFLKSVSEEERRPSSRRASNPGGGSGGHTASRAVETAAPAAAGKTATPTGAKTLKCGECGTLNRPTEWYCERCGAELAGL